MAYHCMDSVVEFESTILCSDQIAFSIHNAHSVYLYNLGVSPLTLARIRLFDTTRGGNRTLEVENPRVSYLEFPD